MRAISVLHLYIFLSIVWPSYIVLKLGALPGLTPDRLIGFFLLLTFFASVTLNTGAFKNLVYFKRIVSIVLILSIWNFASTLLSDQINKSLFAIINWFLSGPFLLIYLLMIIKDIKEINKLITIIVLSMFIVNIIGLIELKEQKLLFKTYLLTENNFTLGALTDKTRDGMFRLRSVFSNPLVYAQYLVATLPFLFYILSINKNKFIKLFYFVNILIVYLLLFNTGSRAGLAIGMLIPFIVFSMKLYDILWFRYLLYFFTMIILIASLFYIIDYVKENLAVANNMRNLAIEGKLSSTDLSNLARVLQLQVGYKAFMVHPIFGYGYGEAIVAVAPLNSIDNYYLSYILSTGIIGLVLLIIFIFSTITKGLYGIKVYKDLLLTYLISSFIVIHLYFLILSITKINGLVYILAGIIFLRVNFLRKEVKKGSL